MNYFSIYEIFDDIPTIDVVDIGASLIDGEPPYQALVDSKKANVVGFEPNPEQYKELEKQQSAQLRFLPYAIGDGQEHVLKICCAPGMTSLLEPDMEILSCFHGFSEWGRIVSRLNVRTRKLDDVEEISKIDYLKLDVQGSELSILENATQKLKEILVLHIEVQFVPFYKDQPLFAELDQILRSAGFYLHCFLPIVTRSFKPALLNDDIYAGLNQVLWTDAVYVRKFTSFSELSTIELLKIAAITHELYGSYDLCSLALAQIDLKDQTNRQSLYILNKATEQWNNGNFEQAVKLCKHLLVFQECPQEAHLMLAENAFRNGDYKEAIDSFGQVLKKNNESLQANAGFVRSLKMAGKIIDAQSHLDSIRKSDPEFADMIKELTL